MQGKPELHVLVAGLPKLACEIYAQCPKETLLLSLNATAVYRRDGPRTRPGGSARRPFTKLLSAYLIRSLNGGGDKWKAEASLRTHLAAARRRFRLPSDAPLRAVAVGGHFSLWFGEARQIDPDLGSDDAMFKEYLRGPGEHHLDEEAIAYLEKAMHQRTYVSDLHRALTQLGLEFHWLHDFVDRSRHPPRPSKAQIDKYGPVTEMARKDLRERAWLRNLNGALSLIYVHNGLGWRLFEKQGEARDATPPSTMTRALLGQFKKFAAGSPYDDVALVKLVPDDPSRWNPCDNPVVTTNDLEIAYASRVNTVLLDKKRGVVAESDDHAPSKSNRPLAAVLGF